MVLICIWTAPLPQVAMTAPPWHIAMPSGRGPSTPSSSHLVGSWHMKGITWLSDSEWARIEPLLPRGRRGAHRVDDRRVVSGIVHMLRSGARWRDCPAAYGPYTT